MLYPLSHEGESCKIVAKRRSTVYERFMSEFQHPFFVYGTLLPGQPNAFLWEHTVSQWQAARLPGAALYDLGHFPMCVVAPAGFVHGMLGYVQTDQYAVVTQRLDQLEGYNPAKPNASPYQRHIRDVTLNDGSTMAAWVYLGQSAYVAGREPIMGGDWLVHQAENLSSAQQWWAAYRDDYFQKRK